MFSGEVGSPRLLEMFRRFGIKTTWFIPGHSMETFPEQMEAVAKDGHEIGIHGYSHENPIEMTLQQEEDVSGRPQVLMMLEKLYSYMIGHPGVSFSTFDEIADDFARRNPRS